MKEEKSKKKLSLDEIEIESFITDFATSEIEGGSVSNQPCFPASNPLCLNLSGPNLLACYNGYQASFGNPNLACVVDTIDPIACIKKFVSAEILPCILEWTLQPANATEGTGAATTSIQFVSSLYYCTNEKLCPLPETSWPAAGCPLLPPIPHPVDNSFSLPDGCFKSSNWDVSCNGNGISDNGTTSVTCPPVGWDTTQDPNVCFPKTQDPSCPVYTDPISCPPVTDPISCPPTTDAATCPPYTQTPDCPPTYPPQIV
jgi:hypothetical protein